MANSWESGGWQGGSHPSAYENDIGGWGADIPVNGSGNYGISDGNIVNTSNGSAWTPSTSQVQNNSQQIYGMYEQQKQAAIAQIKQAIASSKSKYQSTIDQAPKQYQPLKNQVSANRYKNLNSLREMLANQGQQGGTNRTETTRVNAAAENDINTLNTQQQQVIDNANRAIADLEASGSLEEARIVAENAAARIQALTEEANRVESASYQRLRDTIGDARYDKEFDYNSSQDVIKNALAAAGYTGMLNGIPTMDYTNLMAALTGTYNGQPTYQAKKDTIANNLAAAKASSGSAGTNYSKNYDQFLVDTQGQDPEEVYLYLKDTKDAQINKIGIDNYNRALKAAQDGYYTLVLDRWRGEYVSLKEELSSKASYYKDVLGLDNYNKIMKL